ncbi:acyl-coenzyme A thioesterase THEM5 [Tachyglossus aculeatus]|uniref:acyl-coenzyme A thioesterase THEM5 n=1 Tax=Tachyglossus aculeatus TaxID=9261 RepID=UPI0018F685E7|nr:acyl-coenzyme A thioesterase THEM5 [Tachyglossus aculeatus]
MLAVLRSPGGLGSHLRHLGRPLTPPGSPRRPLSDAGQSIRKMVGRFCLKKTDLQDHGQPNPSWSPALSGLFATLLARTEDGSGWVKLPSYKSNGDHIRGLRLPGIPSSASDQASRLFTRGFETEGRGFEYVIFFHPDQRKSVCLFQPGPCLEGPPGFTHGGALAAMIDETCSKTAYLAGQGLFTMNLNIKFKNLIPIQTVAVLDVQVDRIEDQKLFLSCLVRSPDGESFFAKASATFLQLELEEETVE